MKLTDVQIENWRNVLFEMIGPGVSHMTKEQIQVIHDKFQIEADKLGEELKLKQKEILKDDEEIVYAVDCPNCGKEIISKNDNIMTCIHCKQSFKVE